MFSILFILLFIGALIFMIKGKNKIAPIIVMIIQVLALILLWLL